MLTPQSSCSAISITVSRAACNERGARSSPRNLQRARSAKFPAQEMMFPFIFTKNRVIYHFVNDI